MLLTGAKFFLNIFISYTHKSILVTLLDSSRKGFQLLLILFCASSITVSEHPVHSLVEYGEPLVQVFCSGDFVRVFRRVKVDWLNTGLIIGIVLLLQASHQIDDVIQISAILKTGSCLSCSGQKNSDTL